MCLSLINVIPPIAGNTATVIFRGTSLTDEEFC